MFSVAATAEAPRHPALDRGKQSGAAIPLARE
jgi:hypothetical protein